jgi:transcriptional regulator with XRE-family HTH domain
VDLAQKCGLSQAVVSRLERGELARLSTVAVERLAIALGAELDIRLRWRGEDLDRLLDAPHAAVVDRVVEILEPLGWQCAVEITFAVAGERGSVDVLAWHQGSRSVLVVEAKSVVPDLQAMLGSLDRKSRLAPRLAADRGWRSAVVVARVVALPDTTTNRRRARLYGATLKAAFPWGGREFRRWLAEPNSGAAGPAGLSALWFLSDMTVLTATRRRRIRRRQSDLPSGQGKASTRSTGSPEARLSGPVAAARRDEAG